MTILVTGATGFLGGVHVRKLMNEEGYSGKDIRILAMEHENIEEYKSMGVEPFIGNLQFPETLQGIMKDISAVYHIAAIVVNEAANRDVMMKVNYDGTKELARQFLKEESTEKFVFASTLGVYGFKYPKYPVPETHKIDPANNYQESKYLAEQYLMNLSKEQGMDVSAIRNSLIVGPRDTVTSIRVSQGLLNGQISYLGNGENTFSMVDARDSSKGMLLCTKNPQSKGQAYNIKSFDVSQNDYFNYYACACGGCYPKRRIAVPLAKAFAWYKEKTTPKGKEVLVSRTRVDRYTNTRLLDTTKIETELGYKPDHGNPEQVIKESVEWLYNNNYLKK